MVVNLANNSRISKLYIRSQLAYLCFTVTVAHAEGHGSEHFYREYLANGEHCYWYKMNTYMLFRRTYLQLSLAHSKGQGGGNGDFFCEFLANDN